MQPGQYLMNDNMGKISKYSNLYNTNGEFLHGPGSYTVKECEELVDKLAEEDPKSKAYTNAMSVLMSMYEKYGSTNELIQKLSSSPKTTKTEVINALNELNDGTESTAPCDTRSEEEIPGTPGESEGES